MTPANLNSQIERIVEGILNEWTKAERLAYSQRLEAILLATRDLWDKASITPQLDATVGNTIYVSRAEAFKYGRVAKLNELIADEMKKQGLVDISLLESRGLDIYQAEYNGQAWVYNQGYAIPVTAGAKVPLVASAIYSDFYGSTAIQTIKKNLDNTVVQMTGSITRALNQGRGYSAIARELSNITGIAFNRARTIATTEGGRIQSMAYLNSLAMLDEVGAEYVKQWLKKPNGAGKTDREDHFYMDGREADKNGIFRLPSGATGPAPRLTGQASEDINCRCSTITVIDGMKPDEVRIQGDVIPYEQYSKSIESVKLSAIRKYRT